MLASVPSSQSQRWFGVLACTPRVQAYVLAYVLLEYRQSLAVLAYVHLEYRHMCPGDTSRCLVVLAYVPC